MKEKRGTHNGNVWMQANTAEWRPEQQTSITLDVDNDDGDDDNDNDSHILTLPLRRRRPPTTMQNVYGTLKTLCCIVVCMYTSLLLDTLARTNVCWPRFFA